MKSDNSNKRLLGPFNRIEGDLEVQIQVNEGIIDSAWVNTPLFRGYEQILQGKYPMDSLVYTPRICGICSVSQSVAAAKAIANAQGVIPLKNGELSTNLILATENMADHLTHFYLFFMPDFARSCYASKSWFKQVSKRFKAQVGTAVKDVLPARASFLHLTGIMAGKWPHSLAIQPGGTTKPIAAQERIKLLTLIKSFRHFLQQSLFGVELETLCELQNYQQLLSFVEQNPDSDFASFIRISRDLSLSGLGRAADNFMSYGAYSTEQQSLFKSGTWQQNYCELDSNEIREDVANSWLKQTPKPKHPFEGETIPDIDEASSYSWCKAPRLKGNVMEVGAVARQMVNQHPLIQDMVNTTGGNVETRIVARLLELALVVPQMEIWAQQLVPNQPFCSTQKVPTNAQGFGLVEAARGSLGHWVCIEDSKIKNYQIIAPTTWNFSPRDNQKNPGALELALENTPVGDEDNINGDNQASATVQHIIRSFDPCMVCTVH